MTRDEMVRSFEQDRTREMNISKCVSCLNCDIAVACGTTAVVNCLKRNTVLMNSRVAYCRFYEAMEAPKTEDPFEKVIKKSTRSKED